MSYFSLASAGTAIVVLESVLLTLCNDAKGNDSIRLAFLASWECPKIKGSDTIFSRLLRKHGADQLAYCLAQK